MLWLLYVFGVLMVWYENYWIARSYPVDRPPWYSPEAQTTFFVLRIVVTYGTVAALWYKKGSLTAVIAYAAYYIFDKGSFHIYFNRELKRATDRWADHLNREAVAKQLPPDQATIKKEAAKYAAVQVRGNVQGKREWEIVVR
jgi:hypothetical protein